MHLCIQLVLRTYRQHVFCWLQRREVYLRDIHTVLHALAVEDSLTMPLMMKLDGGIRRVLKLPLAEPVTLLHLCILPFDQLTTVRETLLVQYGLVVTSDASALLAEASENVQAMQNQVRMHASNSRSQQHHVAPAICMLNCAAALVEAACCLMPA